MREGTCSSYRYQYQGETAEKDKETGWNHFELREYDPVTGRWLSTDPYGEFWSPYVGMGNDPVNNIDPDGGATDPVEDFVKAGGKVMDPVTVTASYTGGYFYGIHTPAVYNVNMQGMPKTNPNDPYIVTGREFLLAHTDIQATIGMGIDWRAYKYKNEHELWKKGEYMIKGAKEGADPKKIPTNVNKWSKNLLAINKRNLAIVKAGQIALGISIVYTAADIHKWYYGDRTMNTMTNERFAFKMGVSAVGFLVPHPAAKVGVFGVTLIEHWYGDDIERHLRTPNSTVGGSDPLPPWIKK